MGTARRTNRFINAETSIKWNKQRKHACKFKTPIKKPTRTSRNNTPIIIAKDKNIHRRSKRNHS